MLEPNPPGFPPRTVSVQRALCALELHGQPQNLAKVLDELYREFWVRGNGKIGTVEAFGPIFAKVLGEVQAKEILKEMGEAEAKKRLTENTDRAFRSGAFGIPWWECTDADGRTEYFWGFDHLGQVVRFLGLDDECLRREMVRTDQKGVSGMRAML